MGQVGSICQLVYRAVGGGTSPVFRRFPFAAPWFHPVRAGQVVVASCLGSLRVFRGLPGRSGRGGEVVGLVRGFDNGVVGGQGTKAG